jgi:3-oxoacyl-[acyl-carrier protein] reductase
MIDLHGQAALITGGSRGIGAACCRLLARAGARVVINYHVEQAQAERLAREIDEAGGRARVAGADVADAGEATSLVEDTVDRLGGLDVLVANAGIWRGAPIDEISDREWGEMVAVNLTGTFHVIRAAVPAMRRRGGRIILVSSTAGQRGEAGHAHYAATKGALISLTKSLAVELAPHGILTNCVAPGWVETDMTRAALAGPERERILAAIPLGRAARAEEIAGAVLFLASDLATFINGEVLNVNGGAVLVG